MMSRSSVAHSLMTVMLAGSVVGVLGGGVSPPPGECVASEPGHDRCLLQLKVQTVKGMPGANSTNLHSPDSRELELLDGKVPTPDGYSILGLGLCNSPEGKPAHYMGNVRTDPQVCKTYCEASWCQAYGVYQDKAYPPSNSHIWCNLYVDPSSPDMDASSSDKPPLQYFIAAEGVFEITTTDTSLGGADADPDYGSFTSNRCYKKIPAVSTRSPTPMPSAAPTAMPEIEKTEATSDGQCKGWCSAHSTAWEKKCNWAKCEGCSQCTATPDTITTGAISGSATSSGGAAQSPCKQWCSPDPHTWTHKCTWANCLGCSECN
jgi:hypothetical protein